VLADNKFIEDFVENQIEDIINLGLFVEISIQLIA